MNITQADLDTLTDDEVLELETLIDESNSEQDTFELDMKILENPLHPDYHTTMEKYL